MIIDYANDGQEINRENIIKQGFQVNEDRDFRRKYNREENTGEKTDEYIYVLNFVGFLVNDKNDVFVVFPKNYKVVEINQDTTQLFKVISQHIQKRPDLYIGDQYGKRFKSNYPFSAFFGIYEHFVKYGIYFEDTTYIKPNSGNKVNWKQTIQLSNKYISNKKLSFFPIYYNNKQYESAFLTDCMIFAIDYTLNKFSMFIELDKTGKGFPEVDLISGKDEVLEKLYSLRSHTFKDYMIELIDNLIYFFEQLNEGGTYYFKHYSFASIWEDMVMDYLKIEFKEVKDDKLIFDRSASKNIKFIKPSFRPNIANREQYISPDYYYGEGDTQLIFDAKYYTNIHGIDYKQIVYYLFLNVYREKLDEKPKFAKTYAALLLPSETRSSKIHFKMDPQFNKTNKDLVISEEYLDIREVINVYLSN